jgi:hypothetical protein
MGGYESPMNWKRFFKFLDPQVSNGEHSDAGNFLPEVLLDQALRFMLPADAQGDPVQVRAFLENLPVERLFDIDERLRSYYGTPFRNWPSTVVEDITSSNMTSSLRQSLLFVAASHSNGRVRQEILESLPTYPGRLTLAAALIRCADWVPEVREAAQRVASQLLDRCVSGDVMAVWPLVIRLQSRGRVATDWFSEHIEGWMLRQESSPWLLSLLHSPNTSVRAWAYEKSIEGNVSLSIDLLDSAIRDPNPRIAFHALRYSSYHCDEARIETLANFGVEASHPVVRRESLRALATLDSDVPRELLHRMLCDPSAGVRSLAAFLLRERYGEQAIDYWRSVIDGDVARPTLGALASVADNAQAEDVMRLKRWLAYPKGIVRMLCLNGIAKAGGTLSDEEFLRLVTSNGLRVQRAIAISVRKGVIPLDNNRLRAMVTSEVETPTIREHLRGLLRELNHWDRLNLILGFHPSKESELLWFVSLLGDWIVDSNRYVPLGSSTRTRLLDLLQSRRAEMDDQAFQTIQEAIGRH